MTFLWLITGASLAVALLALAWARRTAKRLQRLSESYWELRYEIGQLRARVTALEPPVPSNSPETAARAGSTAFVPLSSLRR